MVWCGLNTGRLSALYAKAIERVTACYLTDLVTMEIAMTAFGKCLVTYYCMPGNLTNLMNCLESLKIFVTNLLVHCMNCADQKSFSFKFSVKRSMLAIR